MLVFVWCGIWGIFPYQNNVKNVVKNSGYLRSRLGPGTLHWWLPIASPLLLWNSNSDYMITIASQVSFSIMPHFSCQSERESECWKTCYSSLELTQVIQASREQAPLSHLSLTHYKIKLKLFSKGRLLI